MPITAAQLQVEIGADVSGAERGIQSVHDRLTSFGQQTAVTGALLTAGLTLPLLGVAKAAGDVAIDYQSSMNIYQAVTGATGEQMVAVGNLAKELGADLTLPKTSAGDAGKAMVELGKAGLSVNDTMAAAHGVLSLAAAGNLDNAQAAEIAANALNAFALSGDKATMIADLFAAAANASSVEVKDLSDGFRMASAVYAAFQGPVVGSKDAVVDLTTALAILGNAGVKGQDAGTSIKQMLLQLTGPSKKAKALMVELAQSVGMTGDIAFDASGKMRSLPEIVAITAKATANMTDEQRDYALTTIFGADATRAILILMKAQGDEAKELGKDWDTMRGKVTEHGAAAELAAARMKGLGGALQGLQSNIETTLLKLAEPLLGPLENIVLGVAGMVSGIANVDPALLGMAAAFLAVLAAAGPMLFLIGTGATLLGFFLTPIGLIVLALAGLAAVLAPTLGKFIEYLELGAPPLETFAAVLRDSFGDDVATKFESATTHLGNFVENTARASTKADGLTAILLGVAAVLRDSFGEGEATRFEGFTGAVGESFNRLGYLVNLVGLGMSTMFGGLFEVISLKLQGFSDIMIGTANIIMSTAGQMPGPAGDMARAIAESFAVIGGATHEAALGWGQASADMGEHSRTFLAALTPAVAEAEAEVSGAGDSIEEDLAGMGEELATMAAEAGPSFAEFAEAAAGLDLSEGDAEVERFSAAVPMLLGETQLSAQTEATGIGANIISGLSAGLSATGALFSQIGGLAQQVLQTAKDALGIKSPSTETEEIGRQLVQGLILGIVNEGPVLQSAIADLVTMAKAEFAGLQRVGLDVFQTGQQDAGINRKRDREDVDLTRKREEDLTALAEKRKREDADITEKRRREGLEAYRTHEERLADIQKGKGTGAEKAKATNEENAKFVKDQDRLAQRRDQEDKDRTDRRAKEDADRVDRIAKEDVERARRRKNEDEDRAFAKSQATDLDIFKHQNEEEKHAFEMGLLAAEALNKQKNEDIEIGGKRDLEDADLATKRAREDAANADKQGGDAESRARKHAERLADIQGKPAKDKEARDKIAEEVAAENRRYARETADQRTGGSDAARALAIKREQEDADREVKRQREDAARARTRAETASKYPGLAVAYPMPDELAPEPLYAGGGGPPRLTASIGARLNEGMPDEPARYEIIIENHGIIYGADAGDKLAENVGIALDDRDQQQTETEGF
jgi:TP901 family phage tail tape measure protein